MLCASLCISELLPFRSLACSTLTESLHAFGNHPCVMSQRAVRTRSKLSCMSVNTPSQQPPCYLCKGQQTSVFSRKFRSCRFFFLRRCKQWAKYAVFFLFFHIFWLFHWKWRHQNRCIMELSRQTIKCHWSAIQIILFAMQYSYLRASFLAPYFLIMSFRKWV